MGLGCLHDKAKLLRVLYSNTSYIIACSIFSNIRAPSVIPQDEQGTGSRGGRSAVAALPSAVHNQTRASRSHNVSCRELIRQARELQRVRMYGVVNVKHDAPEGSLESLPQPERSDLAAHH